MSDLSNWESLNGSSWRTKFNPPLTYNLTYGQILEQYASDFGVFAYPTAVLIGVDYKVRHLDAAWPVSGLPANLDAAIAEMNTVGMIEEDVISGFSLEQNYPNPFNPTTTITYSLDRDSRVKLLVYNSSGKIISELADNNEKAGTHSSIFDASNLNSGIYFYKLTVNGKSTTKKMVLTK
ncbi:MAG: hypothetical protein CR982_04740 [Candidatus Cloacimonadota bacterium]|nr:MAG: hypothetical protein CR982_04740 [Candidatus Cloacimonadota bacterium]PIE81755.1 MAG: hypothetical protein CSA15_00365 [Candidatus Delongbacteria bacterium]